jgi:hypothetical protein
MAAGSLPTSAARKYLSKTVQLDLKHILALVNYPTA